ncbi:amid-like NADH oxidoreductase [Sporothrix brasiliensis 5110]|uniref:Amid-like NADH oxidoreductase n=1 Tax=Sporothrix brasiliensis 5110 TaxID=1398154 RepID=A0A0C2F7R1_9PEZI|nr:amid-like NADH oxidoreductase [Sporothrix brasiliensis 5110]KIH95059.1 amid-like NADH oxidoreductase [Sporothrix brasiliensis 5110]
MSVPKNLVVVGGSYVGVNVAQQLAVALSDAFRVVLVEKNSHFNHLFAFPRFAATAKVDTKKAFIPYNPGTFAAAPGVHNNTVVQAKATGLTRTAVELDRAVSLGAAGSEPVRSIPYEYLVLVTGTQMVPPSAVPGTEKRDGVAYLQQHADRVAAAQRIVLVGGGAVGVQMATDIKELYPAKDVTLVHSRATVMNRFHTDLDAIVRARFAELGIHTKLGSRVVSPTVSTAARADGTPLEVVCQDGARLATDLVIVCTGQTPRSGLLAALSPSSIGASGFVRVRDTLQVHDATLDNVFAIGDVADSGAPKAARPAAKQATVVVQNIQHLLNDEPLDTYSSIEPAGIHMTLGLTKNIVFRNPQPGEKPHVVPREDGTYDMGIDGVWARRGGGIDANL